MRRDDGSADISRSLLRIRLFFLVFVCLELFLLQSVNSDTGVFFGEWEGRFYVRNATHALEPPIEPQYGYRLLPAWFAGKMPWPLQRSLLWLNLLILFGTAWTSFELLRGIKCPDGVAALLAGIWPSFPCMARWLNAYLGCPDALYLLVLSAGLLAIQRRWLTLLCIVLGIGVFTKITILILVPVALLAEVRRAGSWRGVISPALIACGLPVFAYATVHTLYPPVHNNWTIWYEIAFNLLSKLRFSVLWPGKLHQIWEFFFAWPIVFGLFGMVVVWDLAVCFRKRIREDTWMVFFLALTLATSFAGSYDDSRSQTYALSAVLFFTARRIQAEPKFFRTWWVAAPLGIAQLLLTDPFTVASVRDYGSYMPHYMAPEVGKVWLWKLSAAAALLAGLRLAWVKREKARK